MVPDINTFHHLGILARDLETAASKLESLGFHLTQRSFPEFPLAPGGAPEQVGVANRNVILRNSYVEVLGVVDARRWSAISPSQRGPFDIDGPLARYEGLHVLHFGTDDLDATHARLTRNGLAPSPIRPFQRIVEAPDGGAALMRARCLSLPVGAAPEVLFQIVQHETRDLVLQPRHMVHANGAIALSEAILCVEDPERVAERYGQYAGRPVSRCNATYVVDLGESRLVVVSYRNLTELLPGETAPAMPFLAGFAVAADLEKTTAFMQNRNIPFQYRDGRILVSGREGCGASVIFEHARTQR